MSVYKDTKNNTWKVYYRFTDWQGKALHKMMLSIKEANQSVTVMKETSLNNLGIERSMNQSIRFLDQDLSEYLDMTEQMVKSIERIIGKSRFIIGDVPLE